MNAFVTMWSVFAGMILLFLGFAELFHSTALLNLVFALNLMVASVACFICAATFALFDVKSILRTKTKATLAKDTAAQLTASDTVPTQPTDNNSVEKTTAKVVVDAPKEPTKAKSKQSPSFWVAVAVVGLALVGFMLWR